MIPQGKTRGGMKKKYIYNFNTTTTPFNPGSPNNWDGKGDGDKEGWSEQDKDDCTNDHIDRAVDEVPWF